MGNTVRSNRGCIFCEIANDANNQGKILASNEKFVLFADIRPATDHHYLIVPCNHIVNANSLQGSEHATLVQEMYAFAKEYMMPIAGENFEDCLFGFHYPPFVTVNHLHLHAIYPAKSMKLINSFIFWKGSRYFVSPEMLLERITRVKPS